MKRPQSVSEVLAALGYGAVATAAVLLPGCIGCVGNPAPPPRDAAATEDAPPTADGGNGADAGTP